MPGVGEKRQRAGQKASHYLNQHEPAGEHDGNENAGLIAGHDLRRVAVAVIMTVPVVFAVGVVMIVAMTRVPVRLIVAMRKDRAAPAAGSLSPRSF
jgi:hypothetical protein